MCVCHRNLQQKGKGGECDPPGPSQRESSYSGELISAEEAKDREARYALAPEVGCYMYYFEFLRRKIW